MAGTLARSGALEVRLIMSARPRGTPSRAHPPSSGWVELRVAEARHHVIVHHAHRLHERVADRGADEPEPTTLEVPAHSLRRGGLSGDLLHGAPRVRHRPSV